MIRILNIRIFLAGVLLTSTVLSPFVLDPALSIRFVILCLFSGLALLTCFKNPPGGFFRNDPVTILYIFFVIVTCSGIAHAVNTAEAVFESAKTVLGLMVFIVTGFFIRQDGERFQSALFKTAVLIAYICASVFVYQILRVPDLTKESMYAVTGLNAHKNLFASFLFLNLFFLVKASINLEFGWRWLARAAIIINLIIIIMLRTKAVWLGIAVTASGFVMFSFFSFKWEKKSFVVMAALLMILLNVFFLQILPRFLESWISSSEQQEETTHLPLMADDERLKLWDKTYFIVRKAPLFGVGAGNWQVHFPDATLSGIWRAEDLNVTFQRPHNDFLWILSETGISGLNIFFLFLVMLLLQILRAGRAVPPGPGKKKFVFTAAYIAGYYTISFFDFPKERIEHLLWINILLATAHQLIPSENFSSLTFRISRTKLIFRTFLLLLLPLLLVGILRFRGEYFTRKMYTFKQAGAHHRVIRAGEAAESLVYSLDPTSVPIAWYTGNAYAATGNYRAAENCFVKAHRISPYNRHVLNDLASAYVYNKKPEEAKKMYKEAARISPRFDEAKLNLAALYIAEQDFPEAAFWLGSLMHDSDRRDQYQKIVDMNKREP